MSGGFNLDVAFSLHFWRKTVDFLVYVYFATVVAMWFAQDIPDLRFRVFSYTTDRYGANRDYCSLDPLNAVLFDQTSPFVTGVNALFNAADFPNAAGFTTPESRLKALILQAANLPVVPDSQFFSIDGKSYCFGPQHYAVAHGTEEPPDLETVFDIWTQVRAYQDIIYSAADYEPHTGRLVLIYTLALWIYILCRIGNEIYMLVVYWRYENSVSDRDKWQPVFYHAMWARLLPVCINSAVLIMIALKISGTCLTRHSSIYIMFGLHIFATFLQYLPILILKMLTMKKKNENFAKPNLYSLTNPFEASTELKTDNLSRVQISANFQEAPVVSHFMTVYYYIILAIMVQIATLYGSGEIPEIHYSIFNANCDAGTLDGCIADAGGSASSSNANYILLFAAPVLLRLLWAIGYFIYFCSIVNSDGTVKVKGDSTTVNSDGSVKGKGGSTYWNTTNNTIGVELHANVAAITEWRIKRPNGISHGMRLTYGSLVRKMTTTARMRLMLVGRFLIPMIAIFIAILFGILKLSEFVVWHGFPWWGIGIIVVSAIFLSLTLELVPVMMKRMQAASSNPKPNAIA